MRAVAPWSWRKVLRDHGPSDPSLLLTLYVIGTFMDREGFAYPAQPRIAAGARVSVRTVKRHIAQARRLGWLSVESAGRGGQGWRHNAYRCAVPDDLMLPEQDEELAEVHAARSGDPKEGNEREDIAMTPPSAGNGKAEDTAMAPRCPSQVERGDTGRHERGDKSEKRGDTHDQNVGTQLWPRNSRSETLAYRTLAQKAHADASAPGDFSRKSLRAQKPDPEAIATEGLLHAQAVAASIGFREPRADESPQQYAAAVIQAKAGLS